MSDYLNKLVPLFATRTIETIEGAPSLVEDACKLADGTVEPLQDLVQRPAFTKDYEFVLELKSEIEQRLERIEVPDVKLQISECLRIMQPIAMYDKSPESTKYLKIETMRDLFMQKYAASTPWTAAQQGHFSYVAELLKTWTSFFLSYTNEGSKIVNAKFGQVVDRFVPTDVLRQRDRERHNLLADAVVQGLSREMLRNRFYDKDQIKVGDNLDDKIGPACRNTFAFIQLVQLETFDVLKDINWCYEEYQLFLNHSTQEVKSRTQYESVFKKRFNAVLSEEVTRVRRSPLPLSYEPWSNRIFRQQRHMVLPRDPDKFEEAMMELRGEVVSLMDQIIANVP